MNIKSVTDSFYVDIMSMKSKHSFILVLCVIALSVILKTFSFIYLTTLISMLFINDEKGMRAISFAPVNKKSSVYGRYIFALLSFVFCLAINLMADLVAPHFYEEYISMGIYFYILMSLLFSVVVSIQLPLLYWQGYAKIRIILLAILVLFIPVTKAVEKEKLINFITNLNMNTQFVLPLIAAAIILMMCSLFISVRIYSKKDI